MSTLYDIKKQFKENFADGPVWNEEFPLVPIPTHTFRFFGHEVNSLFGVAACPLTHGARGVGIMAKLGYDLITYRSVRSIEWHGQQYPNWRYVNIDHQLTVENLSEPVESSESQLSNQDVTTANSFGIQSSAPDHWLKEFELAQQTISSGQVLILSLMFTPEDGQDVIDDAVKVASYGIQTSAKVFEINLAHPNSGMKSIVYEDIDTSVAICRGVKKILKDKPLIAKIGFYRDFDLLEQFMKRTSGIIDGISSTNTYAIPIYTDQGRETFPGRPKAGVAGDAIRSLSQFQAQKNS